MRDEDKTKTQLIDALAETRQRLAELEVNQAIQQSSHHPLHQSEEKWFYLVENTPDLIVILANDNTVQFINRTIADLNIEALVGSDIYRHILPEYHEIARKSITQVVETGVPQRFECQMFGSDGSLPWYLCRVAPVQVMGDVMSTVFTATDITDRKRVEEELRETILLDELTRLFNQQHFMQRLTAAVSSAGRYDHPLSLCICDLDGLAAINDGYGRSAGNEVFVVVAQLILDEVRLVDIAGRLDEDTFGIIFPHTSGQDALSSVERIRERLARILFGANSGDTFAITASFGVADLASCDMNPADLFESAQAALHQAKEDEGNRSVVYAGAHASG